MRNDVMAGTSESSVIEAKSHSRAMLVTASAYIALTCVMETKSYV